MLETIPLTATLCVDMDLIIEAAVIQLMREIDDFLLEALAPEARKLQVIQGPVKLNRPSSTDLVSSFQHNRRCEEIDC